LTDQGIAYAAGTVSLDAVQNMLGALDHSFLIRLLDALAEEDGLKMIAVADEMATRSLSYKSALQDLGSLLHQIAVVQLAPQALAEDLPTRGEIVRLAGLFNKEEIQLYYQIVVHGRNELALAPDEYAGFSMCLLRMLAFRPSGLQETAAAPPSAAVQRNPATTALANASEVKKNSPISSASLASSPAAASTVAVKPAMVVQAPAPTVAPTTAPTLNSVTNSVTNSAAKPLSPAMAALAAARAASQKTQGVKSNLAPQVTPVEAKVPETKLVQAEVVEKVVAPQPAVATAVAPVVPVAPTQISAPAPAPVAKVAVLEDSGMPPPWDDESFIEEDGAVVQLAASPRSVQEVQPVAIEESTLEVASTVPELVVPAEPLRLMPLPEINWDGHWPNLAASLNLRGIAQQLAQQSELISCAHMGHYVQFVLRVPLQTLLSSGSDEKLIAALEERFSCKVQLDTQIGAVEQTANNQALAERAQRQASAEKAIMADSFVQSLIKDFGASILTGSIRPI
jgi:DNA polymerase-3 subunit gamma/tau